MEKRFFIESEQLNNNQIILTGDEHMHLSKVLRLKVNDEVECFSNNSNIIKAKIDLITKQNTTLSVVGEEECLSNPKVNLTLFQGLPKLDKLELITQKLTELGVSTIIPFSSTFCVAKENLNKIERMQKIIVSACKQCGRTLLTKVENPIKFKDLLQLTANYDLVIFANETENKKSLKDVLVEKQQEKGSNLKVAYIVGSEGGFSKEEIDALEKQSNVYSVSLGKRILRTETASIALGSILLYILGEI
ncbi:MAG: 16S rRNA (uracil(1498)-N(3))-methyltransferase [Clostridia bacterium]|nr:16S rRNA (uracil(1498)-N(3))-methyltransferase [Clostridia bacterium]